MTAPRLARDPHTVLGRVLAAHDHACACTGQCGSQHGKGDSRCREIDRVAEPLAAAPADPYLPARHAARLPETELIAWCPACLHKATRRAQRERREHNAQRLADAQQDLFAL